MDQQSIDHASEVKRLQRCMNDLVSVLALPAVWSGTEPTRVLETFLDALLVMLDLDFLYTRVRIGSREAPIDALRIAQSYGTIHGREEIRDLLRPWLGDDPARWSEEILGHPGGQEVSVFPLRMGIEGDLGFIIAGSRRAGFPEQTEKLILSVAANQTAVGLQQAQILTDQRRIATELDRRVAERTRELAEANQQLQLQVELLQHLPVIAWTLRPNGTPDFINQVWLEYSGQTFAFVCSHPEAWMTAVHPDDRETAARTFWEGVHSGQSFAMETRFLRAQDGTYRWHLNRAVALRSEDGNVLRFVGTSTDIDDQKRAEEELRASETNLRQIVDSIPGLVSTLSADGEVDHVSRQVLEYFGMTREQLTGWATNGAIHPDDVPHMTAITEDAFATERPYDMEHRCRRADGVYRWFHNRAVPVRDADANISGWYVLLTDIDDRKRAEDELKRSEARYRVVVETASDAVVSIDESGSIILTNPATTRVFGYNPEELIGKPLTALMPGAMRNLHETGFQRYLQTGVRHLNWQGTEVTALRANGEEFPAEVSFGEMTADRRSVFTGFIRDISEKKRAEEVIRASERSLSLIINTMPVLAWSALPDGTVDFFNRRWLDYTGLSPEQARGRGWLDAFHPDDFSQISEYWRSIIGAGESGEIEVRLRRFDGDYRWFLLRAEPMRDESGAILKWYGTNTDINDRKRAEEALRIRELNLLQITETIPEMLWSASADGAIEYCNGRLLDYTGFSLEQVMNEGWMSLLHPDDVEPTTEAWKLSVKSGAPYRVEVRTIHAADSAYRWCVMSALPLLDQEGRIVKWHGAVVDMHDWKQAQEQLRNTQAELARMMRVMTIGQLTASIAHEVSQPLSGIITNANTCLRMLKNDPPNIEGALETAQRTIRDGNRAGDVITRLRTLFSKKQINIEPVDVNEAAREVLALLSSEIQKRDLQLQYEFSNDLPRVMGDRVQLQQVILNLLRNGLDAMETVIDRPRRLLIRTETDHNCVRVSVQDSGVGFDPELTNRLFESFFTTKQEGMGIGLSVSRSIVEAHRGSLWATRNDGPGATFAFSIPCDDALTRVHDN